MDPLSIATGCASLITTIGSLSLSINAFVRSCREARSDLDRISRELHSLQTVLQLIQEDARDDTKPFPETIQHHVSGIVTNCSSVVVEVQTCITKYGDGRVRSKAAWVLNGQGDMEKLRSSLEAHKSALELALDMLTLSLTKEIKTDTTEILDDTAAIKDDTAQILHEIAQLQARLPDTTAAPNDYILQKFLEDMATYTETTLDVDGGFSDRASSKALSFIDEREESQAVSPQFDLPIRSLKNAGDLVEKKNPHPKTPADNGSFDKETRCQEDPVTSDFDDTTIQESLAGDHEVEAAPLGPQRSYQRLNVDDLTTSTALRKSYSDIKDDFHNQPKESPSKESESENEYFDHKFPDGENSQPPNKPEEGTPTQQRQEFSPEYLFARRYGISYFRGNLVLDLPARALTRFSRTDKHDFTHSRFSFITCPPEEMYGQRYTLRPTFYSSRPKTKFILYLQIEHYDGDYVQKWNLIHDAMVYAQKKIEGDIWEQVRVHIHIPAKRFKDGGWVSFLRGIGAIEGFERGGKTIRDTELGEPLCQDTKEVAGGKQVTGTMQESTVQIRQVPDKEWPKRHTVNSDIPIQVAVTRAFQARDPPSPFDFVPWTKSIQRILEAEHVIDMSYIDDSMLGDHKFLWRAWTTTRDLVKIHVPHDKCRLEVTRFSDLIKQLRYRSVTDRFSLKAR